MSRVISLYLVCVAGSLLPCTVSDRRGCNPHISFLLRLLVFLEELQNIIQTAHAVAEVKLVPQNKNPSSCDVQILVYLMGLFHLYRLVLRRVGLNGNTIDWCVGKEVEEGFSGPDDCRIKYVSFATRDRENQDDPYDNIQSQRQLGSLSHGRGGRGVRNIMGMVIFPLF